jgi:hypothetical protein
MIPVANSPKARFRGPSFGTFVAAVATIVGLSVTAHASTVIADGGFESAGGGGQYFAGSSIDGGSWNVTLGNVYVDTADPYVYDGSNSLNLTVFNPDVFNSLEQTLTTSVGQQYTVNFWANAASPNIFSLIENGLALIGSPTSIEDNGFPGAITNSSLFVDYSGEFVATSTTTDLTFSAEGEPGLGSSGDPSVVIDDVSIAATPEPGSIVLMLTGMAGLGLLAGKKRLVRSALAS